MLRRRLESYREFDFIFDMVRVEYNLSDIDLLHSLKFDEVERLVAETFGKDNAYDVDFFRDWVYDLYHQYENEED